MDGVSLISFNMSHDECKGNFCRTPATGRPTFRGPTTQGSYILNGTDKVTKTDKKGHH